MHLALLSDTLFLDEELAMHQHLVRALIADGHEVVEVMPQRVAAQEPAAGAERVTWDDADWPPQRNFRLRRLAEPLRRTGAELVHALDGRLWAGALALAERLEAALVLSVGCAGDVALIERHAAQLRDARAAFVAGTEPLAQAVRDAAGSGAAVEVVRPGVRTTDEAAKLPADGELLCAAICGNGLFDLDFQALFEAVRALIAEHPQMQFFVDGLGTDQHQVWLAARRFELLSNLSLVPRRLGHRELLLQADVLIQPQPLGRPRGLTIQALSRGVPVLARQDPWLDYLVEDETAWLVGGADAEAWSGVIRRAVQEPAAAAALGERARRWLRPRHDADEQVRRLVELYRRVAGEPIRFAGQEAE